MHTELMFVGRVFYALALIGFAVYHFMYGSLLSALVPSYLPLKEGLVYFVGAIFLWSAVTLLVNRGVRHALSVLSGVLLIFILTIHLPNVLNGNGAMPFLLKDLALLGATVFMVGASFPHPKTYTEPNGEIH